MSECDASAALRHKIILLDLVCFKKIQAFNSSVRTFIMDDLDPLIFNIYYLLYAPHISLKIIHFNLRSLAIAIGELWLEQSKAKDGAFKARPHL